MSNREWNNVSGSLETYFFGLELLSLSKLGGSHTAQTSLSMTGLIGVLRNG
jgi:hypothetical protein